MKEIIPSHPLTGEGEPDEWREIGKRCSADRRSMWIRLIYMNRIALEKEIFDPEDVIAFELCAGREGGDSFVRVEGTNPMFHLLLDLFRTAMFAAVK